ncbi:Dyp-type peroxidase [Promicromonospora sukumoe]|uniref:Dyp-type peroxidase n=1 Tax=Promicromonospora sukumoe TaxID=88382 RepID=UPI001FEBD98E|nr:Dyp-type peroxidase [Promicromonospora sukumoe]
MSFPAPHGQTALLTARASGAALRRATAVLAQRVRSSRTGVIGLGYGVFDKLGLVDRRPLGLAPMETFAGDILDPARTDADLVVQVDGRSPDGAAETLSSVLRGVDEFDVSWQAVLSREDNQPEHGRALNQNVFGFTEGLANPSTEAEEAIDQTVLVGAGSDEPAWVVGGTYLAVRVLKVSHPLWDAESIELQEQIIGRRRDGTWLDGTSAKNEPDFAGDPDGAVTPLDSHVRLLNPRDGAAPPVMLRRSWTWSTDAASRGAGLFFMAFQADLDEGFRRAQERLAGSRLDRYVLATGGGYFLVPPDRVGEQPWEDALFSSG